MPGELIALEMTVAADSCQTRLSMVGRSIQDRSSLGGSREILRNMFQGTVEGVLMMLEA